MIIRDTIHLSGIDNYARMVSWASQEMCNMYRMVNYGSIRERGKERGWRERGRVRGERERWEGKVGERGRERGEREWARVGREWG